MKYALLGDIHSSADELKQVHQHIQTLVPEAEIVGLGDLFECTISKKKLDGTMYPLLSDVLLNPLGYEELLDFPSIRGNQEERIVLISQSEEPLLTKIALLPERMHIGQALLIHGHQWPYNEKMPQWVAADESLVFHGHTHQSDWSVDGVRQPMRFGEPIELPAHQTVVNVGSVVDHKEWVLYDADANTVTFMKAEAF